MFDLCRDCDQLYMQMQTIPPGWLRQAVQEQITHNLIKINQISQIDQAALDVAEDDKTWALIGAALGGVITVLGMGVHVWPMVAIGAVMAFACLSAKFSGPAQSSEKPVEWRPMPLDPAMFRSVPYDGDGRQQS
jgi:hypothetical protein